MKKSLISLTVLGLSTMALVSCGTSVNSETPYGTISDIDSYATLGDYSLSKKQLYDLMRSSGYSSVLKSIKEKIESIGTPLRDWDINIYRGVLTGFNDAFIIDRKKYWLSIIFIIFAVDFIYCTFNPNTDDAKMAYIYNNSNMEINLM